MDAPQTAGFAQNLDRINALAESQPGFVWRLTGEGNNATDLTFFDDPMILVNLSVWTDVEALAARSAQREELSRSSYAARSAAERVSYRAEAVRAGAAAGSLARRRWRGVAWRTSTGTPLMARGSN